MALCRVQGLYIKSQWWQIAKMLHLPPPSEMKVWWQIAKILHLPPPSEVKMWWQIAKILHLPPPPGPKSSGKSREYYFCHYLRSSSTRIYSVFCPEFPFMSAIFGQPHLFYKDTHEACGYSRARKGRCFPGT